MAKASEGVSALTRSLGILGAFTADTPSLTVSEMARRAGRPVSSTHRVVRELVRNRLLEAAGRHRYRLGVRLWELASRTPGPPGLREAARPFMVDLNRRVGHAIELCVLAGADALVIERVSARGPAADASEIGHRTPLPHSASGLALLAHASPVARPSEPDADSPPAGERAARAARDLGATLETVRRFGYAVADGFARPGATGVAAPVGGPEGRVLAALGAVVPKGLHDTDSIARTITRAARDVSSAYARGLFPSASASRAPAHGRGAAPAV